MKSILYVGATLMIGASIYGFVDYKQTSQKKEFTSMYAEEKATEPEEITVTEKTKPIVTMGNKTINQVKKKESIAAINKQENKKRTTSKEEPITSIQPITNNEKIDIKELKINETTVSAIEIAKESGIEKKVVKKRKFSTRLFGRGALDERYIEPKKIRKVNSDIKKTEDKEQ